MGNIEIQEYFKWAHEYAVAHPEQRVGQAYYNALRELRPELANEINGTQFDPFHIDRNLPQFFSFIVDQWDGIHYHNAHRDTGLSYTTGTGQVLHNIHSADECLGEYCVIHNPSKHLLRDAPTHWRIDRQLMERICEHGIGHPDPDHINATRILKGDEAAATEGVHGCDGCCGCSIR